MKTRFLFFTFLFCQSFLSSAEEECFANDVDKSIKSVTATHGLLLVENTSQNQKGSCMVNEVDNLGFTIVAATSIGQSRVDCEITLFSSLGLNTGWELIDIEYTQLESNISPIKNLNIVAGENSVLIPDVLVNEGQDIQSVEMKLLLWLDEEESFGTLTIKSLTFKGGNCANLSSAFTIF